MYRLTLGIGSRNRKAVKLPANYLDNQTYVLHEVMRLKDKEDVGWRQMVCGSSIHLPPKILKSREFTVEGSFFVPHLPCTSEVLVKEYTILGDSNPI